MTRFPSARLLPALIACAAAAGCGGDSTHRVSGTVTFKGQPVPAGKIYFMPDGLKGNSGPTGYATIRDGKYDTSAEGGRGAGKGPMIVAIEGSDPSAEGKKEKGDTSGEVTIKTLFPRYETATDLPGSDTEKNFDVPADAGSGKPQKGQGPIIP